MRLPIWVLLAAALALSGCGRSVDSARDDARRVAGVLLANEQLYQQVLASEQETLEGLRQASTEAAGRVPELRTRLQTLHERLAALRVGREIGRELISPILDQLETEDQRLAELEGAEPEIVNRKLAEHGPLVNLFTPAIRKIRETYGVARTRKWRGNPLSA